MLLILTCTPSISFKTWDLYTKRVPYRMIPYVYWLISVSPSRERINNQLSAILRQHTSWNFWATCFTPRTYCLRLATTTMEGGVQESSSWSASKVALLAAGVFGVAGAVYLGATLWGSNSKYVKRQGLKQAKELYSNATYNILCFLQPILTCYVD